MTYSPDDRKVIQIASHIYPQDMGQGSVHEIVCALCNDGTIWTIANDSDNNRKCIKLPSIPKGYDS